ncbi:MAG: hypothetical protein ACSW8I_01690, partial [bacterium]
AMALPDEWAGLEVHFYAYVEDWKHQTSETIYVEGRSEKGEVRSENQYSPAGATEHRQVVELSGTPVEKGEAVMAEALKDYLRVTEESPSAGQLTIKGRPR